MSFQLCFTDKIQSFFPLKFTSRFNFFTYQSPWRKAAFLFTDTTDLIYLTLEFKVGFMYQSRMSLKLLYLQVLGDYSCSL